LTIFNTLLSSKLSSGNVKHILFQQGIERRERNSYSSNLERGNPYQNDSFGTSNIYIPHVCKYQNAPCLKRS